MMQKNLFNITIFFILIIILGFTNTFSQTEKENSENKKPNINPVEMDFSSVSMDEVRRFFSADDNLKIQEVNSNGKVLLKLIRNEMVGKSVTDISFKTLDKKTIDSDDFKGKIIVLNFWYVGCKPCMEEIPALNEVVKDYKNKKKVKFYAMTFVASKDEYPDGMKDLANFLKKTRFDFNISLTNRKFSRFFDVRGYPTTVVLDDGKIISYKSYIGKNAELLRATLARATDKR